MPRGLVSAAGMAPAVPADLRERRRLQRREQRRRAARKREEFYLPHLFLAPETVAELAQAGLMPLDAPDDAERFAASVNEVLAEALELKRENDGLKAAIARLGDLIEEIARNCEHRQPGRWCGQSPCVCKMGIFLAKGPLE